MVEVASIDPRDHDGKLPKSMRIAGLAPAPEPERVHHGAAGDHPAHTVASRPRTPAVASTAAAGERRSTRAAPGAPATRTATATARRPQAQPAVASTSAGYYLQVGAFGARANAEQMRWRLRGQLATPVTIAEDTAVHGDARPLFRVRVGPVGSRAEAEQLAGELVALGFGPSLVVPR